MPADPHPKSAEERWRRLLRGSWPLVAGALAGLAMRLLFHGKPGDPFAAMNAGFMLLAPALVGAVAVFVGERQQPRDWAWYAGAATAANLLFVAGAVVFLLEGWICALIAAPLFAAIGAIAGLAMGAICRLTRWRRQALHCFALMPIIVGAMPFEQGTRPVAIVERSIVVIAPREAVWREIENVRDIDPREVDRAWIYRIGVPFPIAAVTEQRSSERVRKVTMGKSIHFEQVVAESIPHSYIRWTYRFMPDSFPPYALDDHVRIGGHYFDLIDTAYSLEPLGPGATRLGITMRYRVNTDFDWYADRVAKVLIGNFADVIVRFYARRAVEAGAGRATIVLDNDVALRGEIRAPAGKANGVGDPMTE